MPWCHAKFCNSTICAQVVLALEDRVLCHARESLVWYCFCWHITGAFGLFWINLEPFKSLAVISSKSTKTQFRRFRGSEMVYVHVFFHMASGHWFSQSLVVKAKTGVHHFHGDNNELGTACGRYYRPSAPTIAVAQKMTPWTWFKIVIHAAISI